MSIEESKIQNGPVEQAPEGVEALRARLREQELRQAEALEQLTYALMHDLSELLRMVRTYVQIQKRRELAENAESNEFATYILDGSQRMEQLLSDLVVYSRQFRPLDQAPVADDAEAVLEGVLLNLDGVIQKSQAAVTYDPLPKVLCDSTQLSHLF